MNGHRVSMGVMLAVAGALMQAGCAAGGTKGEVFEYNSRVKATDYYPLEKGWAWSYDVTIHSKDGEQAVLSTTRVVDAEKKERVLKVGDKSFTYVLVDDGIMKKEAGYHLIKEPITAGAEWEIDVKGVKGRVVIKDVHAKVKVPAGTFQECLVTEERVPDLNSLVRTIFAPGVGIVKVEEFGLVAGGTVPLRTAVLRAYTNPREENI